MVLSTPVLLPILEDFLFEIKNGKMTVFATDLETSMSTELSVGSKDNVHVAIPAKLFWIRWKTLSEQPLTFKVDTKTFAVEIVSETGKYKLSGRIGRFSVLQPERQMWLWLQVFYQVPYLHCSCF